jgi:ubiquinol-cytochrome c reductase cytochrome b subunit
MVFWAISGNPLCWDQEGYGQIEVEGNIIASTPIVGPFVREVLIGGPRLGNLTLTNLYSLHVAAIPIIAGLLLALHLSQLIRHGSSTAAEGSTDVPLPYWPHQSWRNAVTFAVVFGIIAFLAWQYGAPLSFPADPAMPSHPRPEWYFLFLFELRGHFTGPHEYLATVILPLGVLALLLFVPALDRLLPHRPATVLRGTIVAALVIGFAALTGEWAYKDLQDEELQKSLAQMKRLAEQARLLADANGVPPEGAAALLRNHPPTRGPLLFAEHCAHCHRLGPEFVSGEEASDLTGFGTKDWIWGLVQDPGSERFFGRTEHSKMIEWRDETFEGLSDEEKAGVELACQWLAGRPRGLPKEGDEESPFARGYAAFNGACIECHRYEGEGGTNVRAPDFTGYGDVDWLVRIISDPAHRDLYGKKAAMPGFRDKLSAAEIRLLAGWLLEACRAHPEPVRQSTE